MFFTIETIERPAMPGTSGTVAGHDDMGRAVYAHPVGAGWENFVRSGAKIGDKVTFDQENQAWRKV